MGLSLYTIASVFGVFEEMAFYYYYIMCLISGMLLYFFGTTRYYETFEVSGPYGIGVQLTKVNSNRLLIYYPTSKSNENIKN